MLVIVIEALIRIGKRALKTSVLLGIAGAAFVGIYFLAIPFPVIVIAAALIGFLVARSSPALLGLKDDVGPLVPAAPDRWRQAVTASIVGLVVWWAPVALVALALGPSHVLTSIGLFFSKLAVVSFGGAYALLAYMAQQAVCDLRLDDRAGNGRRPRPRGNDARAADPGDAVRRLPRGFRDPRRSHRSPPASSARR